MRKVLAVGAVVLIGALTVGTLSSIKRMPLAEGLQRTVELVETTAAVIASHRPVSPRPDNARIGTAGRLSNNHSFSDRSNSILYPGYNDCDSWKNIVADGWSANYAVELPVSDDRDADHLTAQARQYWESRGFAVQVQTFSDPTTGSLLTSVGTSTEFARLQVAIDRGRGVAAILGTTHCLPPK